jgi:hypothetical protein
VISSFFCLSFKCKLEVIIANTLGKLTLALVPWLNLALGNFQSNNNLITDG